VKVNVRFSREITGRSSVYARAARFLCECAIYVNREYLKNNTCPDLYKSGVKYKNEPIGFPDELLDIPEILKRKWGDCMHLSCWRVAELREKGIDASVCFVWKKRNKLRVFHVMVRHPNGKIEDPSRKLGM
jgi:hypothetical protein